jgi:CheY-like chemotaxis protein
MLHSLADMLRRTLDQRIRIEVDVPTGCPPCLADAGQLESALLNIAINSRDAMPDGGALAFACRPCTELPPDVAAEIAAAAGSAAPTGFVAISIADTGAGMSELVREHAFEPFFTTKESGRGTGLGLSTVYGFVKQSKGAIRLRSAHGSGTTVTMLLPCADDAGDAQARDEARTGRVRAGLKVLLVEDEVEVRRVVRHHLEALGCVVEDFGTAEQALASSGAHADFELLLTDVALGAGMRGTELARRMQARWSGAAVLLMSGYTAETIEGGAHRWVLLRKPFDRTELAAAITRSLTAAVRP